MKSYLRFSTRTLFILMTVVFLLLPLGKRLIEAYQDQQVKRALEEAIARVSARALRTPIGPPPVSWRNALDKANLRRLEEMSFEDKQVLYGLDFIRQHHDLRQIIDSM